MPHSIRYSIKTQNMVLLVLFSLIFSLSPSCTKTQGDRPYQEIAERILKKGLKEQEAYSLLKDLVAIGPRLTGSSQAAKAVEYTHQKMLELDGILGADPPALTATGAFGHIVSEGPSIILINKIQCRRRAIFHTSQATIAFIIYNQVRHKSLLISILNNV